MRTVNSIKNLAASLAITAAVTLVGFFTRKIFVDSIGLEYVGLNALLTNILSVMTLMEGGVGASIVYNLYRPLAEGDREKIVALVQLYRRVYRFIALSMLAMGGAIYPFLGTMISGGEDLEHLTAVFFIFLFNTVVPYVSAHKWSLINADQRQWRLAAINMVHQVGLAVAKLAVVYLTGDYILYLLTEAVFGVGLAAATIWKANRLYPFVATRVRYKVDRAVRRSIFRNSGAIFLHSLGGYLLHSTDNVVISSFVGISAVGLYANYSMVAGYVSGLVSQIFGSFSESVGNLVASEGRDRVHAVFKTVFLFNFLVVSIPVIVLANTVSPLVAWWLGGEFVLPASTVAIILINLYVMGMRAAVMTFKHKSGIFTQDRFSPLIQGVVNLALSLWWVRLWGLAGVLAATTASVLAVSFWQYPRLVYRLTFGRPVRLYFALWGGYTVLACVAAAVSWLLCMPLRGVGVWSLVARGAISLVATGAIYWITLRAGGNGHSDLICALKCLWAQNKVSAGLAREQKMTKGRSHARRPTAGSG